MSDTNITKHPDGVHIGPASLCLYDEINDILVVIGKVDDIRVAKTITDIATSNIVVNGVEVEERGQPTGEQYFIRGKLKETLDPNTQNLVMKNCGTPLVTGVCSIETVTEEVQMYQDVQHILKYNNGFFGTAALPAPQLVNTDAYGTGGTIPSGTYVHTVVPLYGSTRGASDASPGLVVALGEKVAIEITEQAGVSADSFEIYVHDTSIAETILDADLIATIPAQPGGMTSAVFSSWIRGDAWPGEATGSFTITDTTGLIEYVINDDYLLDEACAMLCLVDGGDIEDGQWIRVTYNYTKNPSVDMTIGPSSHLPKYVHPVILAFKDDDRETPVGKGVEIHLYKVLANSSWEWDLSSLNFDSGFEFEWKVLLDRRYMHHGHIYTFHRQFASYELKDFAALTEFTNQEDCVIPSS